MHVAQAEPVQQSYELFICLFSTASIAAAFTVGFDEFSYRVDVL
jgi:hypothetical protein